MTGGTFAPAGGACTSCLQLETGAYDHDNDGSTPCVACAAGKFATHTPPSGDDAAIVRCDDCQPGMFSVAGSTSCNACLPGKTDHDGSPQTPCASCGSGQFEEESGSSGHCSVCGPGSTAGNYGEDGAGATACVPCAVNWYSVGNVAIPADQGGGLGSTLCTQCPQGFQALVEGSKECALACEAGKYEVGVTGDGDGDDELCQSCPAGTYAAAGSNECTSCPKGYADIDSNAASPCERCGAGTMSSGTGASTCVPCADGSWDDDDDATTECRCVP